MTDDELLYSAFEGDSPPPSMAAARAQQLRNAQKKSSSISSNVTATQSVASADQAAYPWQPGYQPKAPQQAPAAPQAPGGVQVPPQRPVAPQAAVAPPVAPPQGYQPGAALPGAVSALRGPQVARAMEGLERDRTELVDSMKDPDYSQMQQYAKERSGEGSRALLLSLAAQEAGKEFEPLGGAMLKRAMSTREPIKTATGWITETGEHVEDPAAKLEQRQKLIGARIAQNEQIINSAATAEEKARAEEERNRLLGMHQAGMRQSAMMQAEAAKERAGAAGAGRDDRRTDAIRREYNGRLQKVQDGATFADQTVQTLSQPDIAKNAPAQVALVMQFGKMLDPDSVVREAEQRMIADARGFADMLMNLIPQIQRGTRLTKDQLDQIRRVALDYQKGNRARVDDLKNMYAGLAQRNGLQPGDIILDYKGGAAAVIPPGAVQREGAVAGPAPATRAGPPPGAVQRE